MEREIKFNRVFFLDEEMKQFSHKHQWGVNINTSKFLSPSSDNFTKSFIDCQFTGLKDKNGVDIYEGDIVKKTAWYFGTNTKKPTESIGQVKWNNESASFLFYVGYYLGLTADNIELEIIGNIHENPELL